MREVMPGDQSGEVLQVAGGDGFSIIMGFTHIELDVMLSVLRSQDHAVAFMDNATERVCHRGCSSSHPVPAPRAVNSTPHTAAEGLDTRSTDRRAPDAELRPCRHATTSQPLLRNLLAASRSSHPSPHFHTVNSTPHTAAGALDTRPAPHRAPGVAP